MAESAYLPEIANGTREARSVPRHSAVVRITHWINALSFLGLLVSGFAILLAHPRFYWGETGSVGTPSLFDLPLPFVLVGQSGWGRYLHFLSAWVCVLTGLLYVLSGIGSRHFIHHLLPARKDLRWGALLGAARFPLRGEASDGLDGYNVWQRLAYLAAIFLLFPLIVVTGFAMSPAITSVIPEVVTVFGGQQSARTIHFFLANLLLLFLIVHLVMVFLAGFSARVGAMITGGLPRGERS
jgi:thiosulfate reductase cytochrome b subunit